MGSFTWLRSKGYAVGGSGCLSWLIIGLGLSFFFSLLSPLLLLFLSFLSLLSSPFRI